MSLDNFQIPIEMIGELYKNSLVVLDEKQIIGNSLKAQDITFLGGNQKNILILVNDSDSVHLNETDLQFLTKVLTQCNLTLADVCIVNSRNLENISFQELSDKFNTQKLICFGNHNLSLPVSSDEKYQLFYHNDTMFLFAKELHLLINDTAEKKLLWASLKQMFSIS